MSSEGARGFELGGLVNKFKGFPNSPWFTFDKGGYRTYSPLLAVAEVEAKTLRFSFESNGAIEVVGTVVSVPLVGE